MITRRTLFAASLTLLVPPFLSTSASSNELFAGVPLGEAPGDYGYKHGLYHPFYQLVFTPHCSCGEGECRVTDWRETRLGSPKGFDVIYERQWRALSADVYIPPPEEVPKELRQERAHICGYGEGKFITIPCAIINATMT